MTEEMELVIAKLTAADAYDYWATLVHYGYDFDGTSIDMEEAVAALIGWASRRQDEIIG
jgi:hypothetical protein